MENASKALVIAGSILVSILLISLGIAIYNKANDSVNNSGMSKSQIETFNAQFAGYDGEQVRGSEIRTLVQKVIANNGEYADDTSRQVAIDGGLVTLATGEGAVPAPKYDSKFKNSAKYECTFTYEADGHISKITIKAAGSGSGTTTQ